jgi:hypothetical protein
MTHENEVKKSISKILSANDIGGTGAHQAGMHIPKVEAILSFFPSLNPKEKNPRHVLNFYDESNIKWELAFIYYNNKFFGGTRNEFRLTRMTKFFKSSNLKEGDELILLQTTEGQYKLKFKKQSALNNGKLKLSTDWKIINLK